MKDDDGGGGDDDDDFDFYFQNSIPLMNCHASCLLNVASTKTYAFNDKVVEIVRTHRQSSGLII